ncbi:MAG: LysR family transcriptional regulator, partial [Steroidobacteraceae bacterium]
MQRASVAVAGARDNRYILEFTAIGDPVAGSRARTPKDLALADDFRVERGGQRFLADRRIALLEAIGECGSITAAAKRAGLSYKAAWDAVEAMNNLAEQPLVSAAVGGARGGGSQLTA